MMPFRVPARFWALGLRGISPHHPIPLLSPSYIKPLNLTASHLDFISISFASNHFQRTEIHTPFQQIVLLDPLLSPPLMSQYIPQISSQSLVDKVVLITGKFRFSTLHSSLLFFKPLLS